MSFANQAVAGSTEDRTPRHHTASGTDWGPTRRVLFRFVFAYLVLSNFPISTDALWAKTVPWVGRGVLDLEVALKVNGSGDQAFHYVQAFCILVLAVMVAAVWTLLDRRQGAYPWLYRLLRIYVRYVLFDETKFLLLNRGFHWINESPFNR